MLFAGATFSDVKEAATSGSASGIDDFIMEWIWKQVNSQPELEFVAMQVRFVVAAVSWPDLVLNDFVSFQKENLNPKAVSKEYVVLAKFVSVPFSDPHVL